MGSLAARPEGRILIPADGWYEWMHAEQQRGGPKPAPFHHPVDAGGWFAFAGLRSRAHLEDVDEPLATVAIIMTDAAGPAARLHDRMPVVLADADMMEDGFPRTSSSTTCPNCSRRSPATGSQCRPASGLVNSARNEGPELLEPTVAKADGFCREARDTPWVVRSHAESGPCLLLPLDLQSAEAAASGLVPPWWRRGRTAARHDSFPSPSSATPSQTCRRWSSGV